MIAAAALLAATVVSPAAGDLAVTVYRDPDRARYRPMNRDDPGGFALVTETRRIAVPAGEAVIRFEGVAGGIIPASAVIEGLPGGTIEKNRDANLLSPAALVDGSLGRQVTLRRTDRASGKVTVEEAQLVAGPGEGVVLRTAGGIETLGCSGLAEALRYRAVPASLAAKPVLSVVTRSPRAADVTVRLAYLATGFDWSASYVATLSADARTVDLFGWTTLANGNREGFPAAQLQVVAGRLQRRDVQRFMPGAEALSLRCYPLGTTTSDLRPTSTEDIVVTARRRGAMAEGIVLTAAMAPAPPPPPPPPPEDLGDLKLYRVPERVSIAASGQKQVALLARSGAPFARVYRLAVQPGQAVAAQPARVVLRLRNESDAGLGLALPSGTTALYARRGDDMLLLGEGRLDDRAVGEKVEIAAGMSRQLLVEQVTLEGRDRLTLTNANPVPAEAEVAIGDGTTPTIREVRSGSSDSPSRLREGLGWAPSEKPSPSGELPPPSPPASGRGAPSRSQLASEGASLPRIDGVQTWRVTVPANGSASLSYALPRRR